MTPNPTPKISKRIRIWMLRADKKRADLREALAETTPNGKTMSESSLSRRLSGEQTWDIHELAVIAKFLNLTMYELILDTDHDNDPDPTEES